MSIIRTEHNKDNPYVMLNKHALEDKNISWAAKGLWAYLMSRPDNWTISIPHLSKIYEEYGGGETAIYNYLNELIKNGYCSRKQTTGEKGQFGKYEYIITEFKKLLPQPGSPDAVPPDAVKLPTTNKGIQINKETTTTIVDDASFFSKKSNDDIDKISEMKKLPLQPGIIQSSLQYPLSDIKIAVECCLSRIESIKDMDAYFHEALLKKWQPRPNKAKIDSISEDIKQKEQQQQQKLFTEAFTLIQANKHKLKPGFDMQISGNAVQFKHENAWGTEAITPKTIQYIKNYLEKNKK
jgi:hypothetical protein